MSYLDHVRACNAHDPSRFRPFVVAGARVGWVRHDHADRLARFRDTFAVGPDGVALDPRLADFDARTAAVEVAVEALVADGVLRKMRTERYAVTTRWGAEPLLAIDRGAVPLFGIASYGLHVNGFVRRPDGLHLWVARRAADRTIAPGKLDNLVAGGLPVGLGLTENLIKEAWEEAALPEAVARRAVPVGAITYLMENELGLKPDTLFVYDLELTEDTVPRNTDGEVEGFDLWPVERVAATVRDTDAFKFNCNLVVIDFLIRHGVLTPENEPDYLDLVRGLRR